MGVEAGHKAELMAEGLARHAYRLHKTAPYRRVAKWERLTQKHAVNHAYRGPCTTIPSFAAMRFPAFCKSRESSGSTQKRRERQNRRKDRQKSRGNRRQAHAGGHRLRAPPSVGSGDALLILMMVFLIMTMFGSCSNMALGVLSSVTAGSYVAEDRTLMTPSCSTPSGRRICKSRSITPSATIGALMNTATLWTTFPTIL